MGQAQSVTSQVSQFGLQEGAGQPPHPLRHSLPSNLAVRVQPNELPDESDRVNVRKYIHRDIFTAHPPQRRPISTVSASSSFDFSETYLVHRNDATLANSTQKLISTKTHKNNNAANAAAKSIKSSHSAGKNLAAVDKQRHSMGSCASKPQLSSSGRDGLTRSSPAAVLETQKQMSRAGNHTQSANYRVEKSGVFRQEDFWPSSHVTPKSVNELSIPVGLPPSPAVPNSSSSDMSAVAAAFYGRSASPQSLKDSICASSVYSDSESEEIFKGEGALIDTFHNDNKNEFVGKATQLIESDDEDDEVPINTLLARNCSIAVHKKRSFGSLQSQTSNQALRQDTNTFLRQKVSDDTLRALDTLSRHSYSSAASTSGGNSVFSSTKRVASSPASSTTSSWSGPILHGLDAQSVKQKGKLIDLHEKTKTFEVPLGARISHCIPPAETGVHQHVTSEDSQQRSHLRVTKSFSSLPTATEVPERKVLTTRTFDVPLGQRIMESDGIVPQRQRAQSLGSSQFKRSISHSSLPESAIKSRSRKGSTSIVKRIFSFGNNKKTSESASNPGNDNNTRKSLEDDVDFDFGLGNDQLHSTRSRPNPEGNQKRLKYRLSEPASSGNSVSQKRASTVSPSRIPSRPYHGKIYQQARPLSMPPPAEDNYDDSCACVDAGIPPKVPRHRISRSVSTISSFSGGAPSHAHGADFNQLSNMANRKEPGDGSAISFDRFTRKCSYARAAHKPKPLTSSIGALSDITAVETVDGDGERLEPAVPGFMLGGYQENRLKVINTSSKDTLHELEEERKRQPIRYLDLLNASNESIWKEREHRFLESQMT